MLHSQEKLTPEQKQMARRRRILQGRAAQGICILAAFAAISLFAAGWLLLRQDRTFSDSENRMLAQKPAPTLASLADGSFAGGIERWYADQFPGRDLWITADLTFQRALGVREMNGVYLGADGYLLEAPAQEDAAQLGQTEAAICAFAAQHPDIRLTAAIVPNAWGVLSEKLPAGAPVEDQKALIDAIDQAMPDVRTANLTEALRSRCSEPLYYRTDHHWTSLGAYYAYQQLCDALGLTPFDTAAHTALTADRFYRTDHHWTSLAARYAFETLSAQLDLQPVRSYTVYPVSDSFEGTLAAKTGSHAALDTIEIYVPDTDVQYAVTYADTQTTICSLYDRAKLAEKNQYEVFFGGNHARVDIQTTADTGRTLLLLKDSYANCFVQFLTPYYDRILMIDPRYFYDDLGALLRRERVTDALILYNYNTFVQDHALSVVLQSALFDECE